jgi:hypothetical protein
VGIDANGLYRMTCSCGASGFQRISERHVHQDINAHLLMSNAPPVKARITAELAGARARRSVVAAIVLIAAACAAIVPLIFFDQRHQDLQALAERLRERFDINRAHCPTGRFNLCTGTAIGIAANLDDAQRRAHTAADDELLIGFLGGACLVAGLTLGTVTAIKSNDHRTTGQPPGRAAR